MGRIVLFGATGYTGRLVAHALVRAGAEPVLAGRTRAKLEALADELGGGLETQAADVTDPRSVRELVERGDVLVSTVGPFARWGRAALQAATGAGAHYIDSTGEPSFIAEVFERWGDAARAAGCGLVTACAYDWVPGNLAGALALERAGDRATSLNIGYFMTGGGRTRDAASGGTLASLGGTLLEPSFAWRRGELRRERSGARVRTYLAGGRERPGLSVGASEHFSLPRLHPALRDVDVHLGWFGPATRAMQAAGAVNAAVLRLPGARRAAGAALERLLPGSSGGPDAEQRAKSGSLVVAEVEDADGAPLARVELHGVNAYSFTGEMLAWAARRAHAHGMGDTGALGPVEAFGLRELEQGVREAGLRESGLREADLLRPR